MVTTKTIAIECTQKEMRKECKHFTIEKSTKDNNAGNEGQKNYKAFTKQIAQGQK